ncbi:MAG TPA: glycerophosphodiester phosphodiesterase family protein [Oleiagrimonas sp.]|nr:glycerophosphodiester phosphodiesterase family protein [Oleiagrimonas sp.]
MKLIAHRGGAGLRVENTLAAFTNAIDLGAEGAELDVHLSRDGHVVVHHDDALNPAYCRHAGGRWIASDEALALSTLTHVQMQDYDIGTPRPGTAYARHFDRIRAVPNQRIPLLREVIAAVQSRSTSFILVIEIKTPPLQAAHRPWRQLVDATLEVVHATGFADRTILCSFDWGALRYAKQCQPDLATWFTTSPKSWFVDAPPPASDIPPNATELQGLREQYRSGDAAWFAGFDPRRFGGSHARAIAAAGGNGWFPFHRDFTAGTASELEQAGLDSAAWSVNLRDTTEFARLAQTGLNHLATDYPDMPVPA